MEQKSFSAVSRQIWPLVGALAGALLAAVLMQPLRLLTLSRSAGICAVALYAVLMFTGAKAGMRCASAARIKNAAAQTGMEACPKVLDTSVIIDGRVFDICKAGFLEGELVIPTFVLDELRHIADSTDALRRARGRRGLDLLQKIREELDFPVRVEDWNEDGAEVDVKLLRLAMRLNGAVMTNDYNLNKAAGVAKVPVLNINELAGALRPVVLPGEEMTVHIVREGKEPGQGVAYLDDGTMVVVENGRRVGETLDVEVTTVLQTSAGRMIFTRIKAVESRAI